MSDRPLSPHQLAEMRERWRTIKACNPDVAFHEWQDEPEGWIETLLNEVGRLTEELAEANASAEFYLQDLNAATKEADEERAGREQAEQLAELILDRFDLALDEFDPTGDLRAEYQVLNDRDREVLGRGNQG